MIPRTDMGVARFLGVLGTCSKQGLAERCEFAPPDREFGTEQIGVAAILRRVRCGKEWSGAATIAPHEARVFVVGPTSCAIWTRGEHG